MKCDPGTLKILKMYDSVKEAAEDIEGNQASLHSGIQNAANGKQKTCAGFAWRWKPLTTLAKGAINIKSVAHK